MLIFYKAIDFSVLNAGFTIPIVHKEMLFSSLGFSLKRGDRKKVTILIGSEAFSADMVNIMFNEEKYPTHQDLLQIRYAKKSPLAQKLRETFSYTQQLIAQQMQLGKGTRLTGIPEKQKEFLAIYSSPIPDTLLFDCIVNGEFREETSELCSFGEVVAESILDGTDPHADILLKTRVSKIAFFVGMVASYYLYSNYVAGFFPKSYAMIWVGFTLLSPILAFFCWYAKGTGWLAIVISAGIMGFLINCTLAYGMWYVDLRSALHLVTLILGILMLRRRNRKETLLVIGLSMPAAVLLDMLIPFYF